MSSDSPASEDSASIDRARADRSDAPKRLHLKTYGCQMNVYDSQRMTEALAADGYVTVDDPAAADLVLINTCHIREKASEKLYSDLGRMRMLAEVKAAAGERLTIGVAGCVAQAEGAEIMRRQPVVDVVVGPQAYHRLPELVRNARLGAKSVQADFPVEDKFGALPPRDRATLRAAGPTAFLTVQEGCDKFCSFCVVPFTRGAEASRPVARVLDEARALADAGVRELTLLGQNVNAYHGAGPDGRDWGLGRLLEALSAVPGLARLRYTTSHPNDVDDALIAAHRDLPAVMPYLHLPVQSGSDRVLKAMNRKHTVEAYERIVDRLRAARPDLALSSDFIVGFPGESDADFEATLALVRRVGFASAYSFGYSARPGTPAAERAPVAAERKAERLARLQALIAEQQTAFQRAMVGRVAPVLIEKPGRHAGQLMGRSPWLQAVHVTAPAGADWIGRIVDLRIVAAAPNSLAAETIAAA